MYGHESYHGNTEEKQSWFILIDGSCSDIRCATEYGMIIDINLQSFVLLSTAKDTTIEYSEAVDKFALTSVPSTREFMFK